MTEAAASSRYIHLPKKIAVLVNQVVEENYFAIKLTLKAYVLDTQYEKAFETDITLRVLDAFKAHQINPPAIIHRNYYPEIPDMSSLPDTQEDSPKNKEFRM